ncbi:hypothetical protein BIV57_02140 [Mangrovactinospora gilvigrisea]|uniref:Lipoprotein n=1 Tax=Mangrovactinospora gilvigrisea TaxID=1428644 RepID=A0A1J7CC93_9ACTN|nr:hypothetical protein BIV57_02140 [Mangrovactinospora gilvigrisea]
MLIAACAATLMTGCLAQDPAPKKAAPDPSISTLPKPTASRSVAPLPSTDPGAAAQKVAESWVKAYVGRHYADPNVNSYLGAIAPYSTPALVTRLRSSTDNTCSAVCQDYRKNKTVVSAQIDGSNIPDEAPRTSTQVWVEVSYEEQMDPDDDDAGDVPKGMQLVLVKVQGKWLVDKQIQR